MTSAPDTSLRIAVVTPHAAAYSETFIVAHLQRLKEVVLVLSGGSFPKFANGQYVLEPSGAFGRVRAAWEHRVMRSGNQERITKRVLDQLKKSRAQVVLAEYGPTGAALLPICQAANIPLVVHFHGYDAHKHETLKKQNGYKGLLDGAAAIVVVSRAMEQQLLRLGAPRERLHLICYGIDTALFTPGGLAEVPPHFLAVGRFTGKKAPLLTLMAFHRAWLQQPQMRLTIAGTGELWEAVWLLRRALGLEQAVDLPGIQSPLQVAQLMRNSRAFVQHSVTSSTGDMEGTPLAILEAMASGLPVVSTRHAGIIDVVAEERTGLLGDEFDLDTMTGHMARLAAQPDLATRLGSAGRNYVIDHHRVEAQVGKLQNLLHQVAARALAYRNDLW